MRKVAIVATIMVAIGCSKSELPLKARFDSSGELTITNASNSVLEYSGNLLGGIQLVDGDFDVLVRREGGQAVAQCGVFDPFTKAQKLKVSPGDTIRISIWRGQIESLYCFSPGERGTVTVRYVRQRGADRTVLLVSNPVEFVAVEQPTGKENPFNRGN